MPTVFKHWKATWWYTRFGELTTDITGSKVSHVVQCFCVNRGDLVVFISAVRSNVYVVTLNNCTREDREQNDTLPTEDVWEETVTDDNKQTDVQDSDQPSFVLPEGHTFGDPVITVDKDGTFVYQFVCTDCGETFAMRVAVCPEQED